MIKNRNIALDASIDIQKILGGGLITGGEIHYVGTSTTASYAYMQSRVESSKLHTSIDTAIGQCTADRGDCIIVLPGYTETISAAAGIAMDVAGVSIVGLGTGTLKPTLTFSATTSDINVSAANCLIKNFRMVSSINNLVNFIDADAGQLIIEDCDFVTSSAKEALCFIDIATTNDDFEIRNCTFLQPTDPEGTGAAAGTGAIYCVDTENILIENCRFRGFFETAIVHNKTTKCQNLIVKDCELSNSIAVPFILVADVTGACERCYGATLVAADATEATVFGTIGTKFWISQSTSLGNDSAAGGQGSITGTVAS